MPEPRDPEQIRSDCVAKLHQVEVSGKFAAILGCLLGEDWASPKIENLYLTPDHHLLARIEGEMTHRGYLGAEEDLLRNIHGVADVAELDGDEIGYLVGRVAGLKRIE